VDLRLLTNNNKVDLWTESLDFAIRFGAGAWHGTQADLLMRAPITPLCSPATAAGLRHPGDLEKCILLRSYRAQDWPAWLTAAGQPQVSARGPIFDASPLMIQAAILGEGVALAPAAMFQRDLNLGSLVQPFPLEVDVGAYWLTRLMSRPLTRAMEAFQVWLTAACANKTAA
jgi:LysR family transcriptional regulator of beta-lactamase